jgi:hypothetical protein
MMYGGNATPTKKRKKMSNGGQAMANAEVQSRIATGRATEKDKQLQQKQTFEEMMRKGTTELQAIASDKEESAMRRQMAKRALTQKGGAAGAGAFPSGDKEPTN